MDVTAEITYGSRKAAHSVSNDRCAECAVRVESAMMTAGDVPIADRTTTIIVCSESSVS